jgi:hypothetical protein
MLDLAVNERSQSRGLGEHMSLLEATSTDPHNNQANKETTKSRRRMVEHRGECRGKHNDMTDDRYKNGDENSVESSEILVCNVCPKNGHEIRPE